MNPDTPPSESSSRVAAIVLAAGDSTRMGGTNKLLETLGDSPIVTRVVDVALASGAWPVVVVTGHQGERVAAALGKRSVELTPNRLWQEGMATSLAAGIEAVEGRVEGALICLGDMPRVMSADLTTLIEAFRDDLYHLGRRASDVPRLAWIPVHDGRRGNPVLWAAHGFPGLRALRGDRGAKGLLDELVAQVREVPAGPGVLLDVDTPEELDEARKKPD